MIKKYIAGVVSLFVFALSFMAVPASQVFAQTTPVCPVGYTCTTASTTPPTTPSCYVFSNYLTLGSTGADVTALQMYLISRGFYLPAAGQSLGYFDAATKAGVIAYQGSVGLPEAGFVGPLTIAKLNGACVTPGGSTTTVSGTEPTVKVDGTPQLTLTYAPKDKEASLTATFKIVVNGGTNGVNINSNGVGAVFTDQKGNSYNSLNSERIVMTPSDHADIVTDTFGQKLFVVPALHSVKFEVVATVNPQQLFGGVYHASLNSSLLAEVGTSGPSQFNLPITKNTPTGTKTIIGEISPYISSVSNTTGTTLVITGQRLNGVQLAFVNLGKSTVYIDGLAFTSPVVFSKDGTTATLTLPSSFAAGSGHALYISNSITGISNYSSFHMGSATSTYPILPTVTMNGSPILVLAYNSSQKESSLTATFNFTVTAGSSNLFLSSYQANAALFDQNNNYAPVNSLLVNIGAGEKSDPYGRNYTELAPGTSVQMSVILGANPAALFAGTYYASLINLYMYSGSPSDSNAFTSIPVLANQTNSKTIIGELSPYITSVTNPISVGQTMTIKGQRLTGTILVDNLAVTSVSSTDMSSRSFTLPVSTGVGQHYLSISNPITGSSNQVAFQVNGTASLTVLYPNGGEVLRAGATTYVTFNPSGAYGRSIDIDLVNIDTKGESQLGSAVTGQATDKQVVTVTIPASTIAGNHYKVRVSSCDNGGGCSIQDMSDNYFTITPSSQGNQSPVISGGTFPTTLSVGQTGTWTVNASDPQNGPLSYSVNWGDATSCPVGYVCSAAALPKAVLVQSSTFTHSYANAGVYTVVFTVQNSAGLTAQTTTTVAVGTATAPVVSNSTFLIDTVQSNSSGLLNNVSFRGAFTLTAAQDPLFIASNPTVSLSLSTTPNGSSVINSFTPSGGLQSFDGSGYYMITPGSSRTFNVSGILTNNSSQQNPVGTGISAIHYSANSSLSSPVAITSNLQSLNSDLHLQVLLGAAPVPTTAPAVSATTPAAPVISSSPTPSVSAPVISPSTVVAPTPAPSTAAPTIKTTSATLTTSCLAGYTLSTLFTGQCYKSGVKEMVPVVKTYSCPTGYTLNSATAMCSTQSSQVSASVWDSVSNIDWLGWIIK